MIAPPTHTHTNYRSEAGSAWQLFNFAEQEATRRGRRLLRVNLDETAVCLHPGRGKGNIFVTKSQARAGVRQRVPKWKRRCYMTHIGIICDDPSLQAVLPQFIVANERTFQARRLPTLARASPRNVTLIRQKSAWSNAALMRRVVRELAVVIARQGGWVALAQVALIFDAATIHIHDSVLRACKAVGFWVVIVPPKTTSVLQPLDVDAFAMYKAVLVALYHEARTRCGSPHGDLDIAEFLPCVYGAIRQVLQGRRWAAAFDRAGFGAHQTALATTLKQRLQITAAAGAPLARPSDDQLRLLFPRRWAVPTALFWSFFDEPTVRVPAALPARAPRDPGAPAETHAAPGPRTRADYRRAAAEVARASGLASEAGVEPAPAAWSERSSRPRRLVDIPALD